MKPLAIFACIASLIGVLVVADGLFVIHEYEQAVIIGPGKASSALKGSGIHLKMPFIQKIVRFDTKAFRWAGGPQEIITRDSNLITLEASALWRIDDPLLFLQTLGSFEQAYGKLDDLINPSLKSSLSSYPLIEIIRSDAVPLDKKKEGGSLQSEHGSAGIEGSLMPGIGSEKITRYILADVSKHLKAYGIKIVDIRIRHMDFGHAVTAQAHERMAAQRKAQAAWLKSEGEGKKAEIMGRMEKDVLAVLSEARRNADEIKGRADAEAARIYGQAYNKDPEFYSFYKTMETYRETSFDNTTLVLGDDADFYRYLKGPAKGKE